MFSSCFNLGFTKKKKQNSYIHFFYIFIVIVGVIFIYLEILSLFVSLVFLVIFLEFHFFSQIFKHKGSPNLFLATYIFVQKIDFKKIKKFNTNNNIRHRSIQYKLFQDHGRPSLGSFKIQQCRGIRLAMLKTRLTLSTRQSLSTRHALFLRFFVSGDIKWVDMIEITCSKFEKPSKTPELPKTARKMILFEIWVVLLLKTAFGPKS